jgi:hypothetical protein
MIVYRPPERLPYTAVKVAILSGLSDPSSCALAASQTRFLKGLDLPDEFKIYRNFPYLPCHDGPGREPPLWLASGRNLAQFLMASAPRYRDAARRHWDALLDSAARLVVITLSCGLEIVNQCLAASGPCPALQLIALGPVAWRRPPVPCTLIQGSNDRISKLFFGRCELVLARVGHMGYLEDERVSRFINEIL